MVERAVILSKGPVLDIGDELATPTAAAGHPKRLMTLEEMERDYILTVLKRTRWVIGGKGGAAEILCIHPNTLRSRLLKLGIKKPEYPMP